MLQPILSKAAQQALMQYSFPGNVRELHNVLERALTLNDGQEIQPDALQLPDFAGSQPPILSTQQLVTEPPCLTDAVASVRPDGKLDSKGLPSEGLETYLEEIEKQIILQALESSYWNRTVAAKKLGMTFRSLRYRLKKFGLDSDTDDEDESR